MNDSLELYSTPKIDGQGDGIKNITVRKRVPIMSSRKFNARVPRDETLKLKLENALAEMQGKPKIHDCLKKSKTVAEITPTKNKAKKRLDQVVDINDAYVDAYSTLHATPRNIARAPRRCSRPAAVCAVTRKMMLLAWRRNRARLETASESCGSLREQISQLELQVDVLKNLRNSENDKRRAMTNECHVLKGELERLENEKIQLIEEMDNTKEELKNTSTNLGFTKCDLKKCNEQLMRLQDQLKKKKEEKMDLMYKLTNQDREISAQSAFIKKLEETLKTTEMNLQNTELNFKTKKEELNEIFQHLQTEVERNSSLKEEISNLEEQKIDLKNHSRFLEDQLDNYIASCENLQEQNQSIRQDLEEVTLELKRGEEKWYKKTTKELALLSLSALQKITEVILPVFLDSSLI